MGVSVYPVFNKEVAGFDVTEVSGKALADVLFEEGSLFEPLLRFNSTNADELRGFISDQTGQDPDEIVVPAEEWFAPEEGLEVIRPLLERVRSHPNSLVSAPSGWERAEFFEGLRADLSDLERVLVLAQEHQAQFHLSVDF